MELEKIHRVAAEELKKAFQKHGYAKWSRHEFYAILLEEFEELWDDIKADAPETKLNKELYQIIAVCYRFLNTGDKHADKYKIEINTFLREILKQDVPPYQK